jgi:hypothetical protein
VKKPNSKIVHMDKSLFPPVGGDKHSPVDGCSRGVFVLKLNVGTDIWIFEPAY